MDLILTHEPSNLALLRLPRLNNNQRITIHTGGLGYYDCTFYFYTVVSFLLIVLGSFITMTALGWSHHPLFSNLGHMWSVGPICVCCGIMMGLRSLLYLRSKRELQMLAFPERPIALSMQMLFRMEEDRRMRILEEIRRTENARLHLNNRHVYALVEDIIVQRHSIGQNPAHDLAGLDQSQGGHGPSSCMRPPPSYDVAMAPEAPPPSYEEAIALIDRSKPPATFTTISEVRVPA